MEKSTATVSRPPLRNEKQRFALVVMVGPEALRQHCKDWAFNILGCFRTAEESNAFARKLQAAGYDSYDMYTVQTQEFITFPPPSTNELDDVQYSDKLLQSIMQEARKKRASSEDLVQRKAAEYNQTAEKAAKAAQTMRKATDEERKNLRVRLGEPQTTAPEGVDMSQVIKMKV